MKKSTFGFLATAAFLLIPTTAFAQDAQSNLQLNRNTGAADGYGNVVNQTGTQSNYQDQFDYNGYYNEPSSQSSIQDNASVGAAVGAGNFVNQEGNQYNLSLIHI